MISNYEINYRPKSFYYLITHEFRAKNAYNAYRLITWEFTLESNLSVKTYRDLTE
jgi:hypothetical protein